MLVAHWKNTKQCEGNHLKIRSVVFKNMGLGEQRDLGLCPSFATQWCDFG